MFTAGLKYSCTLLASALVLQAVIGSPAQAEEVPVSMEEPQAPSTPAESAAQQQSPVSSVTVEPSADPVIEKILKSGVPRAAFLRVVDFLKKNDGKTVSVAHKFRESRSARMGERQIKVANKYAIIIDFTLPSSQPRLYYINLETGAVDKHYVAHGKGSGVNIAKKFSNIDGSKMSSLGLYLLGNTYYGTHGKSLNLYGLEKSNNAAAARDIVMHPASYVSLDFVKSQGRLGRSWGCPALAPAIMRKVLTNVPEGSVIYAYHEELTKEKLETPSVVEVKTKEQDEVDVDLPGEEESIKAQANNP